MGLGLRACGFSAPSSGRDVRGGVFRAQHFLPTSSEQLWTLALIQRIQGL